MRLKESKSKKKKGGAGGRWKRTLETLSFFGHKYSDEVGGKKEKKKKVNKSLQ